MNPFVPRSGPVVSNPSTIREVNSVTTKGQTWLYNVNQHNNVKIINPERIVRIMQRMVEGHLVCLIRADKKATLAVKARFNSTRTWNGKTFMFMDGMSEKGLQSLTVDTKVHVEVLGMKTKITFASQVTQVGRPGILLQMPAALLSVERRNNARHQTTEAFGAFIKLAIWKPDQNDFAGPPMFDEYEDLASWFRIRDLSLGGFSAMTRFPSVLKSLGPETVDPDAQLILPGLAPYATKIEVRWSKRTKEAVKVDAMEHYRHTFQFGARFIDLNSLTEVQIKHFLKQLSMATAI